MGVLKFRDMIKIRRMIYHHEILQRDKDETINKIYVKQREDSCKGDWYRILQNDFKFIGEEINEIDIKSYSKAQYKKIIKSKVKEAAFIEYMKEKETHKKKLGKLTYETLQLQPYMTNKIFTRKEINLLHRLRSNCYQAKMNFRKIYKKNLNCSLNCDTQETQKHIFE